MRISHFYIFCDRAQTLRGFIYMFHWLVVMVSTTTRISVRPKRLKWIKTVHQEASGEFSCGFITIATVKNRYRLLLARSASSHSDAEVAIGCKLFVFVESEG